jgi:hypothetical protein
MELAKRLGLGYRAVQAATSELSAEGKIHGRITGKETYGCIEWHATKQ